jgi:hypothetical protein
MRPRARSGCLKLQRQGPGQAQRQRAVPGPIRSRNSATAPGHGVGHGPNRPGAPAPQRQGQRQVQRQQAVPGPVRSWLRWSSGGVGFQPAHGPPAFGETAARRAGCPPHHGKHRQGSGGYPAPPREVRTAQRQGLRQKQRQQAAPGPGTATVPGHGFRSRSRSRTEPTLSTTIPRIWRQRQGLRQVQRQRAAPGPGTATESGHGPRSRGRSRTEPTLSTMIPRIWRKRQNQRQRDGINPFPTAVNDGLHRKGGVHPRPLGFLTSGGSSGAFPRSRSARHGDRSRTRSDPGSGRHWRGSGHGPP